ncbi:MULTISPECIES: thioredoxin domain-containing protein [unclassified Nitrobacter]|uniref:thioredoxin domain-containing protein n=1 Tax=unclassified Nitrobacter TaxID=2620411 RepID=UPI000929759A|nr:MULTISPECIES: thioredoxin domain-containing protein [unclassified Nitrobacter]MBN9148502.1 thioredoxin domain-containing protein [Nitrobacter sp.]OJV00101.1 MAG: thioredoxin domain-containing protein [Nitrobacter sp. 62-23]
MNHAAAGSGRPANRLAAETSPYLLQHQHNPVDWWPWGPDALAEAQRTNRPILLSIGYAACHWCHVMAHESFEDDEVAAVMNELFVCIKVDREERPDIDQIYMAALHHLGEQGGWPLTMFLSSDGSPFWGGTYFPKLPDYGRPAFTDVLQSVARVFHDKPDRIAHNRDALLARLSERARSDNPANLGPAELDSAAASIAHSIDPVNGGLHGAPKFPQCSVLEFLWRAGARTGNERFFAATALTLTRMSQGGIYDHLGGGYARYSVDDKWLVPHFEKMLYDNAQILDLLALDYARSHNPLYRERAIETVDWLRREMLTGEGGFASSLDADSEGEEGKFYVWSLKEIEEVLGAADAADFAARYDITARGNFEGHNIPNRLKSSGLDDSDGPRIRALREKLLARRASRVRPGLDDKVLADWNGLMIAALVHAARAFDVADWLQTARTAYDFVRTAMTRDGRLGHSWREGRLLIPALASDYAAMGRAALALFEATGDNAFLEQALCWQAMLDTHYADVEHGGYYLTADDAEGLIVRPHSTADDSIPNHDGLIAQNLVRLAALTGDTKWRERIDALFAALLPNATATGFGQLSLMNALDLRLTGAEIVVVGEGAQADALLSVARKLPHATNIVLHAPRADALPPDHPARAKADSVQGAAVFVCRNQSCSLPVTTPEALIDLVKQRVSA